MFTPKPAKMMGPYYGKVDAFVLPLDMVFPHSPPFSKIESTSDGIDRPWIVTHIGQGGMVDGWWQSAPGKITAPPTLRWEPGGKKCGYLSGKYGITNSRNASFNILTIKHLSMPKSKA